MSAYVLANAADPMVVWALNVAEAAEAAKAADQAAAQAHQLLDDLLVSKPQ